MTPTLSVDAFQVSVRLDLRHVGGRETRRRGRRVVSAQAVVDTMTVALPERFPAAS